MSHTESSRSPSESSEALWSPGAYVGSFVILSELGRGGMGIVYEAVEPQSRRRVAIKTLLPHAPAATRERFQREAEIQARVDQHPNVGRVVSAGVHAGRLFHVQDYAPGGDLAQRLRAGALSPREARALVAQVADGVAHLHARGVVHRDLKPQNVLFAADQRPLIVDFGVARFEGADSLTRTGQILGTIAYMAPEQLDEARQAGPPADVYALGALLYACLTCRPPFTADSSYSLMTAVFRDLPAPLGLPGLDPAWESFVQSALAKDPAGRPASALAFREALLGLPLPSAAPAGQPSRSRAAAWAGLALLVIALALALGVGVGFGPTGVGERPGETQSPTPSGSVAAVFSSGAPSAPRHRWLFGAGEAEYRLRWNERSLSGMNLTCEGLLKLRRDPSGHLEIHWDAREASIRDESSARHNGEGVFSTSSLPSYLLEAGNLSPGTPMCVLTIDGAEAREVAAVSVRSNEALKAALAGRMDTPLSGMEVLYGEFVRLVHCIYEPRTVAQLVRAGFLEGPGAVFESGAVRARERVEQIPLRWFFGDLSLSAIRAERLGLPNQAVNLAPKDCEIRVSGTRTDDPAAIWPTKITLDMHVSATRNPDLFSDAHAELTRLTVRSD